MSAKILLVEDDEQLQLLVKTILTKAGYEFFSALTGEEGLEKLLTHKPDLVILDNMMPRKTGEQVFDEVMKYDKYESARSIPFVMLTAKQMRKAQIDSLLEQGMAAHLMKPFGQRELLNVIQNILTTHDIQQRRKHLLKTVRKAKDFLSDLIESIPDALFIVSLEGRIDFYNGGHKDVLGYEFSELRDGPISDLFGTDSPGFAELVESLGEQNKKTNIDITLHGNCGKEFPFSMSIAKLCNENDGIVGYIFIGTDVSEIKRLEAELIEKEKLQLFYETAVAINHEVNNPLAPILGNIQLLLEDKNKLDEETCNRLESIGRNAMRIRQITEKLSKIKRPVHTAYLGDTKMVDIRESD
ncbi:MAG: response regulator [bacterium]